MEFAKYSILLAFFVGMMMMVYGAFGEHKAVMRSHSLDRFNPYIDHTQLMVDDKKYTIILRIGVVLLIYATLASWFFAPGS